MFKDGNYKNNIGVNRWSNGHIYEGSWEGQITDSDDSVNFGLWRDGIFRG